MNRLSFSVVVGCVLWVIFGDPFYLGIGMGIGLGVATVISNIRGKNRKE